MQKIHQLGHAFESIGMLMVGGSSAGFLATDKLPPDIAGYITIAGVVCFLVGKFLIVFTGEHYGEPDSGDIKISVKTTDETPTKTTSTT